MVFEGRPEVRGTVRRRAAVAAEDVAVIELAAEAEPHAEFATGDAEIAEHIHRIGREGNRALAGLGLRRHPRDRGVPVLHRLPTHMQPRAVEVDVAPWQPQDFAAA